MSKKERLSLEVLSRVRRKELTRSAAASLLDVSERQVYRQLARSASLGASGLVHGLRGRPSNRGHTDGTRSEVIRLYKQREYRDYGPQLFKEVLASQHGITVSRETVRRWLMAAGLWSGRCAPRRHRKRRERREGIGTMVQFDGSPHDWFEGRGPACCLLVAIDDCSSRVFMRFAPSEDTEHVMRTLWGYMERYGIPQALYTDHGSAYGVSANDARTEVARALERLGVRLIQAHSPQAKGRVERANRTHQDRLIKAMRREGIATIEAANAFLDRQYLAEHNARFASTSGHADVHRSTKTIDFANIFCFECERQVRNDYTVQLDGHFYQLQRGEAPLPPPGRNVTVRKWLDGSRHLFWNENELAFQPLDAKPIGSGRPGAERTTQPAANHPWRRRWATA
ncbi:MAG: ISNCY family transposase [Terriglobia bacterium]